MCVPQDRFQPLRHQAAASRPHSFHVSFRDAEIFIFSRVLSFAATVAVIHNLSLSLSLTFSLSFSATRNSGSEENEVLIDFPKRERS